MSKTNEHFDIVLDNNDKRCVYCWETAINNNNLLSSGDELNQLSLSTETNLCNVVPRMLPCGQHICCWMCLKAYLEAHDDGGGVIHCPLCPSSAECTNIDELAKVELRAHEPNSDLMCDTGGCGDGLAVAYCSKCDEKLCEQHHTTHKGTRCNGDDVIPIEAYKKPTAKEKLTYCNSHVNSVLLYVCTQCLRLTCEDCVTLTEVCHGKSKAHKFVHISDLLEETTAHVKKLLVSSEDRITELCRESKKTWQKFDSAVEKCAKAIEEVDGLQDESNIKPVGGKNALVAKIKLYEKEVTHQVLQFDSTLMSKKHECTRLRNEMHRIMRDCCATDILRQANVLAAEMSKRLDEDIGGCRFRNQRLLQNALKDHVSIDFVSIPSSLTFSSSHPVQSWCYSAWHRSNGDILVGCERGLWLVKKDDNLVTKYDLPLRRVTTVVEYNNLVYILHEKDKLCQVEAYNPEITHSQVLFNYMNTSGRAASMSVNDKYILAYSPDLISVNRSMHFYDQATQQVAVLKDITPLRPHFLPDGNVAMVKLGLMAKCSIDITEFKDIWTCEELDDLHRARVDSDGLIWGACYETKTIYLISPQGEKLETFTGLPPTLGEVSMRGHQLAVPGWKDKCLHLYTINY